MRSQVSIRGFVLPCLLTYSLGVAAAPEWQLVGEGDYGKASVRMDSIQKQGEGIAVTYRLDFPVPQHNTRGGKDYLSTEVRAVVFCRTGDITRYELTAFAGKEGTGEVVGGFKQSLVEAQVNPIAKGGTDENLWRYLCADKAPAKKK